MHCRLVVVNDSKSGDRYWNNIICIYVLNLTMYEYFKSHDMSIN